MVMEAIWLSIQVILPKDWVSVLCCAGQLCAYMPILFIFLLHSRHHSPKKLMHAHK